MTAPDDLVPRSIRPPTPVVVAGALIGLQAAGVLVLTAVILASGLSNSAATGQLLAEAGYFVLLAAGMAVCGLALLRGRRWGRTPTILIEILLAAVGYWLAVPSGRPAWGIVLIVLGVVTGGLLLSRPANAWINRFPSLFGPAPGR